MLFSRPEQPTLDVHRSPVTDATCPACGSDDVAAYPLLRINGWVLVVRCQSCLHDLETVPSPTPFGFTYLPYSTYVRPDDASG